MHGWSHTLRSERTTPMHNAPTRSFDNGHILQRLARTTATKTRANCNTTFPLAALAVATPQRLPAEHGAHHIHTRARRCALGTRPHHRPPLLHSEQWPCANATRDHMTTLTCTPPSARRTRLCVRRKFVIISNVPGSARTRARYPRFCYTSSDYSLTEYSLRGRPEEHERYKLTVPQLDQRYHAFT